MNGNAITGCLLGAAVGDALGLPYEGLSRRRGAKLLGAPDRHRFLFGRGMCSDDTEHALLAARALISSQCQPDLFERHLARSLRWWLASIPAGVGFATMRAVCKLWFGCPPQSSGVRSAGNGPAMRSPILGVVLGKDVERLKEFVLRSTRMTHSDPRAFQGALTVAIAAHLSASGGHVAAESFTETMRTALAGRECGELPGILAQVAASVRRGDTLKEFAPTLRCQDGISGYILCTVPCVIHVWLRHQDDYPGGLTEIVSAGGDADTTAAILGAIIGARTGRGGIPAEWFAGVAEWPHGVAWMEDLSRRLTESLNGDNVSAPAYFTPALVPRNAVFLATVLCHGLRRLAPPY